MKKKIAFLLAATMVLSAPMTAFANVSDVKPNIPDVAAKTLFPTYETYSGNVQATDSTWRLNNIDLDSIGSLKEKSKSYIGFDTLNGTNPDGYKHGDQFQIDLNNANWFYAEDTSTTDTYISLDGNRKTYDTADGLNFSGATYDTLQSTDNKVRVYRQFKKDITASVNPIVPAGTVGLVSEPALTVAEVQAYVNSVMPANSAFTATNAGTVVAAPDMLPVTVGETLEQSLAKVTLLGTVTANQISSTNTGSVATNNVIVTDVIATGVVDGNVYYQASLDNSGDNSRAYVTFYVDSSARATVNRTVAGQHNLTGVTFTKVYDFVDTLTPTVDKLTGVSYTATVAAGTVAPKTVAANTIKVPFSTFTAGTVEMPLAFKTMNEKNVTGQLRYMQNLVTSQNINISTDRKEIELTRGIAGLGTTAYTTVVNGREKVSLNGITIEEKVPGTIRDGKFEIALNNGYEFANVTSGDRITVKVDNLWATASFVGFNKERTKAYFDVDVNNSSTGVRRSLVVEGLQVRRINDYSTYSDQKVLATVRGLVAEERYEIGYTWNTNGYTASSLSAGYDVYKNNGDTRISKIELLHVATLNDYGLLFDFSSSTSKPTVAYSGIEKVVTPELILKERATDSWWSDRKTRFSLVDADGNEIDGVKIQKVTVLGYENIKNPGETLASFTTDDQVKYTDKYTFSRNFLEVRDLDQTNTNTLAHAKLQFVLNTAGNFVGDVYVKVSGTGVDSDTVIYGNNGDERDLVKIAEIKAPITIDTKSTDVVVGYQTYAVKDITVKEVAKGLIRSDRTLTLTVSEFANAGSTTGNTDISFNPITLANIKMNNDSNLTFGKVTLGGNKISVSVSKPSNNDKKLGDFTVSGLAVKIDRDVPNGGYDLVVGGSALVDTYKAGTIDEKTAMFPIEGVISADYIKVATPGDAKMVARNVILAPGSKDVTIDGKLMEGAMEPVAFISEEGRTMIPLRVISKFLGIQEENVIWNPETGTATVIMESTNGPRTVTFTNNSSVMTINDSPVSMVDENNVAVKAQITADTGRMFIPFRQLATAFGIAIEWDAANSQVIFNPTEAQKTAIKEANER